jgi:hypothetical protein
MDMHLKRKDDTFLPGLENLLIGWVDFSHHW